MDFLDRSGAVQVLDQQPMKTVWQGDRPGVIAKGQGNRGKRKPRKNLKPFYKAQCKTHDVIDCPNIF